MAGGEPVGMALSMEAMHDKAIEQIRSAYEAAAEMRSVRLEVLNRGSPPALVFHSIEEVVHEWLVQAEAMSTFAVNVGLISGAEALKIVQEFCAAHPDIEESMLTPEQRPPAEF